MTNVYNHHIMAYKYVTNVKNVMYSLQFARPFFMGRGYKRETSRGFPSKKDILTSN